MVQTSSIAKRQEIEECTSCMESVLFNSDSLFKIASYLPAEGLLNLALTCRRFGIGGDVGLSLIEETARRIVHDIATNEEKNALPVGYDGDNWLSKFNYLQLLRKPLTFDQLVGPIEYVEGKRSCVTNWDDTSFGYDTAFSSNIMMAGKHYVSFEAHHERNSPNLFVGVMRPGEAIQGAKYSPLAEEFYQQFTQQIGSRQYNNSVNCCMYNTNNGHCWSSDWEGTQDRETWNGMERLSPPCKIGMLLDLDEGTLSVYNNGRMLGVMKRGLAGHYCWAVTVESGTKVTIKRETVPAS